VVVFVWGGGRWRGGGGGGGGGNEDPLAGPEGWVYLKGGWRTN